MVQKNNQDKLKYECGIVLMYCPIVNMTFITLLHYLIFSLLIKLLFSFTITTVIVLFSQHQWHKFYKSSVWWLGHRRFRWFIFCYSFLSSIIVISFIHWALSCYLLCETYWLSPLKYSHLECNIQWEYRLQYFITLQLCNVNSCWPIWLEKPISNIKNTYCVVFCGWQGKLF